MDIGTKFRFIKGLSKIKYSDMGEDKIIWGRIIKEDDYLITIECDKNMHVINKKDIKNIKTPLDKDKFEVEEHEKTNNKHIPN